MLQSLSVPAKSELAPREAALAALRNIEAIRVDQKIKPPGGGSSRYVVDLYLRAAPSFNPVAGAAASGLLSPATVARSQLALHDLTAAPGAALSREHMGQQRDPNKTIGKMYLEVFEFVDALGMTALSCRCAKRCRLCQSVFEYVAGLDKTPPAIVRAFSTTEMKKHQVEALLNALVGIAVRAQILTSTTLSASASSSSVVQPCPSDEKIPVMIREFLGL